MRLSRRRFLALAGAGLAAGGTALAYQRGLRFPPPLLAGAGPLTRGGNGTVDVAAEGAVLQAIEEDAFLFRSFAPEPRFVVHSESGGSARVVVENVHPEAAFEARQGAPSLDETRTGLSRSITLEARAGGEAGFSWRFPRPQQYRFAAIGDTGGGTELVWVLERAAELGADFLIHLGDFHYEEGDMDRAGKNLNEAAIPTFAAIGNHDFHDDGWRVMYPEFHRLVGPSNAVFALGGVQFVNFDTAADFIPAERGRRADIIEHLEHAGPGKAIRDRVAFTHMPLRDPDAERDHAVGRPAEARWLRDKLLSSGTRKLLAGHIHIKAEFDDAGLYTYITGQGLAHADLIVERPFAEILLGDVEPGQPVRYQWQPLNMPFEAHCNARNLGMLDTLERPEVKDRLMELCGKA